MKLRVFVPWTLAALPALALGAEPVTIVAFGDSTTAPRGKLVVYANLLQKELPAKGLPAKITH